MKLSTGDIITKNGEAFKILDHDFTYVSVEVLYSQNKNSIGVRCVILNEELKTYYNIKTPISSGDTVIGKNTLAIFEVLEVDPKGSLLVKVIDGNNIYQEKKETIVYKSNTILLKKNTYLLEDILNRINKLGDENR